MPHLPTSRLLVACLVHAIAVASCAPRPAPTPTPELPVTKPQRISSTHVSTGKSSPISMEELFSLQQSDLVLLYDVRETVFYQKDHLPGAINWPHTDYLNQIQSRDLEIQHALKSGKKVVFYCFNKGCAESRNVAHKVARRDYNVFVFKAGIDAWREAGLPLE